MFRDILGREYLDCLGGYGLLAHGWSHPEVVDAVRAQLTLRSPMPSQELIDPLRGALARLMALITPGDLQYSFFCASGTEAIEGAIKLAKMYTKKDGFIAAVGGFHGKTMGSLSLIGKADFRQPVGTLYGGPVYHVPFGDAEAVERQLAICRQTGVGVAGVLMEPIQGEAGAIVPPDDFWPRLREMTRRYGVLLIADEVQTGMGRTGALWGVDHWGVVPDILAVAKALGGGVMPVGAFCSTADIWQVMMHPNPFIHTTTTGGGALACSAAIAAIHVMLRDRLWEQAAAKGEYLLPRLRTSGSTVPSDLRPVLRRRRHHRTRPAHRHALPRSGGRLPCCRRPVPTRGPRRRHADQRPHRAHRAAVGDRHGATGRGFGATGGHVVGRRGCETLTRALWICDLSACYAER